MSSTLGVGVPPVSGTGDVAGTGDGDACDAVFAGPDVFSAPRWSAMRETSSSRSWRKTGERWGFPIGFPILFLWVFPSVLSFFSPICGNVFDFFTLFELDLFFFIIFVYNFWRPKVVFFRWWHDILFHALLCWSNTPIYLLKIVVLHPRSRQEWRSMGFAH